MYTIKFLQYNDIKKKVLNEKITLENIVDVSLEGKPTKVDKLHLTDNETWAKYAFENEKEYYTTIYQNEKPIACINNYFLGVSIDFLTYNQGELFIYLSMSYQKYDVINQNKDGSYNRYSDDKMFLRQINLFSSDENKDINNRILFKDNGIMNVETITEIRKPEPFMDYEEKETPVSITHNWIDCPKDYKDYEYLLDYKNILKPEYLDL